MGVGILGLMGLMDTARNASSNGGDASRVGKICSYYLVALVSFLFIFPTRDASLPLELAFGGGVCW